MTRDTTLQGVILMLAFCVIAPLLDVGAKLAAENGVPVGQITTARFVVQTALMLPVVLLMRLPVALSGKALAYTTIRALLLLVSTFAFVSGIQVMPLADALAIVFVEPFILLILGHFLFGDQVGPRRIAACAVGFIGVVIVMRPGSNGEHVLPLEGIGFGLMAALLTAGVTITLRQLRGTEHVAAIVFWFFIGS